MYIARYIWLKQGLTSRQVSQKLFLYGLAAVLLLMVVSGRIPWLVGVVGAAVAVIGRLLPLLRFVPIFNNFFRRFQHNQSARSGAGGQTSSVQSRYLYMILHLDTGDMDGEILLGSLQGRKLSEVPVERLIELLGEFSDDQDSLALLQTYLDRMHSHWRERADSSRYGAHHNNNSVDSVAQMNAQEAYDILGLETGASKEQIVAAHRRLIQKLHPDRGGSGYLAAKINKAKDYLLKLT